MKCLRNRCHITLPSPQIWLSCFLFTFTTFVQKCFLTFRPAGASRAIFLFSLIHNSYKLVLSYYWKNKLEYHYTSAIKRGLAFIIFCSRSMQIFFLFYCNVFMHCKLTCFCEVDDNVSPWSENYKRTCHQFKNMEKCIRGCFTKEQGSVFDKSL